MTQQLYDFVDSWFYDEFCKAKDCLSHDSFVSRTWRLYRKSNDPYVDECLNRAIKADLATVNDYRDVRDLLSDFAGDVIHDLCENNDLPYHYADLYDIDVYGESL